MRNPGERTGRFIELGAIATVGDVDGSSGRKPYSCKRRTEKLSRTSNKGLRELIRANGLEDGEITAYHVGFVLGPCINASGRLDTAARSLKLLCAETEEEAAKLAGDLTALNQSRKASQKREKKKQSALWKRQKSDRTVFL